jgi:hypothetical protein
MILQWYDENGNLLQEIDNLEEDTPKNRRALARDARRQIGENKGMSDAPKNAHHFRIVSIYR